MAASRRPRRSWRCSRRTRRAATSPRRSAVAPPRRFVAPLPAAYAAGVGSDLEHHRVLGWQRRGIWICIARARAVDVDRNQRADHCAARKLVAVSVTADRGRELVRGLARGVEQKP